MDRRGFASAVLGGLSALVAGCPGLTNTDGAALVVQNDGGRTHTYEIETDERQSTTGQLAAGESVTFENFIPYQDYRYSADLRVAVDDETVHTATIHIHTDIEQLYVEIGPSGSVEIGPDRVYSPTPPN